MSWRTLTFHQLWANMLVQYADEYALVLRLVVISLLIPADTSECERIFSLMNDLKTVAAYLRGFGSLEKTNPSAPDYPHPAPPRVDCREQASYLVYYLGC